MLRTWLRPRWRISRHQIERLAAECRFRRTRVAVGRTATAVTGECVCAARVIVGDIPAAETETSTARNAATRFVFRVSRIMRVILRRCGEADVCMTSSLSSHGKTEV
jgi:hypothetical protein